MAAPEIIRFYGRRYGRPLKSSRQRLIKELLPTILISADSPVLDVTQLFDFKPERFWLEIGFGAGEHLADLVAAHPDTGFVGCEPFINGVASLLAKVGSIEPLDAPKNLRIFPDDARLLTPQLPTASFDRIYAMFPDPWPKKRHNRRRLISTGMLDELARLLRPGGQFKMASDHMEYIRWTLWHFQNHPSFEWLATRPRDWRNRFQGSSPTRYETKALSKGATCHYLTFRRLS